MKYGLNDKYDDCYYVIRVYWWTWMILYDVPVRSIVTELEKVKDALHEQNAHDCFALWSKNSF